MEHDYMLGLSSIEMSQVPSKMEHDGAYMEHDPSVKEMSVWVGELFSIEP